MGEQLAEKMKAPSIEPGRYDLVIDPTNLWLTIHESIGHATEYDRAIGYEAAYAGTSFATPDKLGSLVYGSPMMNVTGDRTVPHGLATIGYDDDGVAGQSWDLISRRHPRRLPAGPGVRPPAGAATGRTAARTPTRPSHIPIQRMANVSLQPDPAGGSTADLICRGRGRHLRRRRQVVVDRHAAVQLPVHRAAVLPDQGRPSWPARSGTSPTRRPRPTSGARWTRVGGPQTYLLGGAFNCGKGQPGQVAAVSHGCPSARFRGISILNTVQEGRRDQRETVAGDHGDGGVLSPQQIIDAALAASTADGCVVVVQSSTEANIRWANNTVTTNGLPRTLSWFVVGVGGGAAGTVAGLGGVGRLRAVGRGGGRGRARGREGRRTGRPGARTRSRWSSRTTDSRPISTQPRCPRRSPCSTELIDSLAAAFDGARAGDRILYGFARHEMTTTHLGSSTGLRLRWVQPTGLLEVNAKSADLRRSAWAGLSTAGLRRRRRRPRWPTIWHSGWSGPGARSTCRPAGTTRCCRRPRSPISCCILAWSAGARAAHEGRSAFSAPGGGTRLGERLTDRGMHAVQRSRPPPAWNRRPFVVAASVQRRGVGVRQRRAHRPVRLV